jgi:hypothetical protein
MPHSHISKEGRYDNNLDESMLIFRVIAPGGLVDSYKLLWGTYCLNLQV